MPAAHAKEGCVCDDIENKHASENANVPHTDSEARHNSKRQQRRSLSSVRESLKQQLPSLLSSSLFIEAACERVSEFILLTVR